MLRALVGDRATEGGDIRLGGSITPAYYRQDLTQVPADQSLYDVINDLRPMWGRGAIQGHLGRFGFSGDSVQRSAATLSGGERARVALAMIMLSRANLLLLDEPTNHLDVESIEALEDAVERYDGTVFLVSHDRALLRALANRVWILHDRHITDFDGSFAEWETASAEREHAASVAASEEQESRRVRERQKTRTGAKDGKKESAPRRRSREEIANAEARSRAARSACGGADDDAGGSGALQPRQRREEGGIARRGARAREGEARARVRRVGARDRDRVALRGLC